MLLPQFIPPSFLCRVHRPILCVCSYPANRIISTIYLYSMIFA